VKPKNDNNLKKKIKKDKKLSLTLSNQSNFAISRITSDYDPGYEIEPIEPIEIPVDDEYTSDDDEIPLGRNHPMEKPINEGQDDSEVGEETDEDTE